MYFIFFYKLISNWVLTSQGCLLLISLWIPWAINILLFNTKCRGQHCRSNNLLNHWYIEVQCYNWFQTLIRFKPSKLSQIQSLKQLGCIIRQQLIQLLKEHCHLMRQTLLDWSKNYEIIYCFPISSRYGILHGLFSDSESKGAWFDDFLINSTWCISKLIIWWLGGKFSWLTSDFITFSDLIGTVP